jgi:acetoin utilization protein AcuB
MFIDTSMTREVITIGPDAGIFEAREIFEKYRIHSLPVVSEDNTLLGIVTDRDVRSALPSDAVTEKETTREMELVSQVRARDIMTRDPVTVSPANTLADALLLMERGQVGAFPVVDQERKLIGIITVRDIMRAFINVLGLREPGMLLCILAGNKLGTMKRIVDAISEERNRSAASLLPGTGRRGSVPFSRIC